MMAVDKYVFSENARNLVEQMNDDEYRDFMISLIQARTSMNNRETSTNLEYLERLDDVARFMQSSL